MNITPRALTTAVVASTALTLAACGDSTGNANNSQAATVTVTESATSETTTTETTAASTETSATDTVTGEDPVFATLDSVKDRYPGATVIEIDRDNNSNSYEIEVVEGDEVVKLDVDADRNISERERERDSEDVSRAQEATVSIEDALRQALDRTPGGVIDDVEFEREGGALTWEIELDDADGRDLAELNIPAV